MSMDNVSRVPIGCRLAIPLLTLVGSLCHAAGGQEPKLERPNFLLIVADDMGFSDAGCYGGEIATPNLDSLANGGLRFTQCYNTSRCWPSRAAMLTGYYAQQVRRDVIPGIRSGIQGVRPPWARLLPEWLRAGGYRSYHSGKWHIDGRPLQNGFDRSYSLDDHDRHFAPRRHSENDRSLPPVTGDSRYYSSTAIADHAIKFLREHAEQYSSQPFFGFVAFTAPHFPLQAPAEEIARYRNKYRSGWDAMRDGRWQRLKSLEIGGTSLAAIERDLGPPYEYSEALEQLGPNELSRPLPWKDLSPEQQDFQANKMAVHAAMVDRMDQEIGRVLTQLRTMGAFDNTLVFFLSDNGASAEIMVRGDGHDPDADCGTGATFLSMGPGWSSLANTPFRRHKTWVHEGGISTPFLVHWPKRIAAHGELRHAPCHVIDLVPTILAAAGIQRPETWESAVLPPLAGRNLLPLFERDGTIARDSLWWYHEGNRALRVADWKIVATGEGGPWELYDLSSDRAEANNLAEEQPATVRELAAIWAKQLEEFRVLAAQDLTSEPTR
jgi:arylsulfatase